MKRLISILVVIIVFLPSFAPKAFAERGTDKYNPTNLEWFVMDLNSRNSLKDITKFKFAISYHAKRPNTVIICVDYLPNVNEEYMNETVNSKANELAEVAIIKSWDWLKIEKNIKILETRKSERLKNLLAVQ